VLLLLVTAGGRSDGVRRGCMRQGGRRRWLGEGVGRGRLDDEDRDG
jgi:hypothetical protein